MARDAAQDGSEAANGQTPSPPGAGNLCSVTNCAGCWSEPANADGSAPDGGRRGLGVLPNNDSKKPFFFGSAYAGSSSEGSPSSCHERCLLRAKFVKDPRPLT